jgi:beta-galactosidase
MKKVLFILFIYSLSLNAQINLNYREKLNIDFGWKFYLGDVIDGSKISYNDNSWRTLNLPHDWSIEGEFNKNNPGGGATAYLPTGIGWYRKILSLPETIKNKKAIIQFDGVFMNSDVWVNEHFIGRYPNGFNSFYYDISDFIQPGNNTIAVRVDNSNQPASRWYTGSGIYRHVWLTITDPLHIEQWGTTITTPEVTNESATINISTRIRVGAYPETKWFFFDMDTSKFKFISKICKLTTKIFDDQNNFVGQTTTEVTIPNFTKLEVKQEIKIKNPNLWSTTTPRLYKAYSVLEADSKALDDYITSFGIRKFTFDPIKGFMINDKPMKVKGVCIHQDAGPLGSVIPKKIWVRKLQILKEMGCNGIRNHCANSPEFLDVCDSLGFMVLNDAFDEWSENWERTFSESSRGKVEYGYNKYFDQWCETDLRNFIRRDRNHPSVFMWSLGNEIPEQYSHTDDAVNKLIKLIRISQEEDPTRPNTLALEGNIRLKLNDNFTDLVDVTGFNYVDQKNHEKYYENYHKTHPNRMILGTETFDNSLGNWLAVRDNNYTVGQFMWVGIDYLGEAEAFPNHGWANGLVDINLNPKPEYFFRQSLWAEKPMVYLAVGNPHMQATNLQDIWNMPNVEANWNWIAQSVQKVNCYTNCEEAELFLNGKSFGTKQLIDFPDYILKWDVPYLPGILKVVGKNKGKEVCNYQLETTTEPAKLQVTTVDNSITADGRDIAVINIAVTDKKGLILTNAENLITFEIAGEGQILAASNANQSEESPFKTTKMKAFHGKCQVIVQSTTQNGIITLTVKAGGLPAASIVINTK